MIRIAFCFLLLCFSHATSAQNPGAISGTCVDTILKQPVSDVTITILQRKDSSLVTFGRSNQDGAFQIQYLPKGIYRILATHIGYRNYSKNFEITDSCKQIDAGFVVMTSKAAVLDEVTITQESPPVIFKNDTIEFNAGSFKTKPNAVVEDLLKKLPGVQVDKDGKIKANGEEVKKILVDGKEFFGNDPKIASKNLPSDIVDKVQVFDKKSDQSQFTGFDDGNSTKTINLTLKSDKKNGMFGRASAAAGNKGRYQGSFNLNSFNGEEQISALGMANNTNKKGFSFLDMFNFNGGMSGGGKGGGGMEITNPGLPVQGMGELNNSITTTWAGGLNFNDNWGKNLSVNGSYFYNRIEDFIDQRTNRQYLVTGNSFNRLQDAITSKKNEGHRVNLGAEYTIDSLNSIKLTTTTNVQNSLLHSNSTYQSISDKGFILNDGISSINSKSTGYNSNNNLLWRHKFLKKGRTLSANFSAGVNNAKNDGSLHSQNSFYHPGGSNDVSDTLDQENHQQNEGFNYGVTLSYTEPLSRRSLLEATYNFSRTNSESGKKTFDKDPRTGKYNMPNGLLTNDFSNEYTYQRPGANWRFQNKKFSLSLGSSMQFSSLESRFHSTGNDSLINRSFTNLLPTARLQYNINKFRNFRFNYTTFTRQPGVSELNPIPDNTDPLNIQLGNPDLAQEYNHRLQFNYIAFDPYRHTSFFSMISFTAEENSIVTSDEINQQGVRVTQPTNTNGVYDLRGTLSWGLPLKFLKSNVNINTNFGQGNNVSFINGNRNMILTRNLTEEIVMNFVHKELLDISIGANISFNSVRYSLTPNQSNRYWNQEYLLDAQIQLAKGFSFASEFTFTRNTGYANGFNANVALWNAGVAKQLFRNKKGEIKLQMFDILNENVGISRNANQNFIEDVYSKVLNRYFLVSFTYNISRFAGKSAPVQRGGNIKVVGERNRL